MSEAVPGPPQEETSTLSRDSEERSCVSPTLSEVSFVALAPEKTKRTRALVRAQLLVL
jgi:hypothetical protein